MKANWTASTKPKEHFGRDQNWKWNFGHDQNWGKKLVVTKNFGHDQKLGEENEKGYYQQLYFQWGVSTVLEMLKSDPNL